MRSTLCRMFAVAVFTATPVVTPALAHGAAPTPAATKTPSPMDAARKALDEVGDMNYQGKSLNEVIGDLKDKAKVSVTIDPAVYQFGLDPNQPNVTVALKQVKLKDGLQQALAPFNLRCGLTKDGLYISTEEGLVTKQLRQRVSVNCEGTAFGAAVKQLSADCGANIVLDPRLKDKANAAVTLKLDDVPLETAIRLLAEVADLGAVRMSNVLFVTTTERAEKLRPNADGPTQPAPGNPVFPFPAGGPVPVPGIGIGGGAPGVILPAPANPAPAQDLPAPPPAVAPAPTTPPPAPPAPGKP